MPGRSGSSPSEEAQPRGGEVEAQDPGPSREAGWSGDGVSPGPSAGWCEAACFSSSEVGPRRLGCLKGAQGHRDDSFQSLVSQT